MMTDRLEKLGLVIALLWAFGYVVGYYHAPRPDPVPVFGSEMRITVALEDRGSKP